MASRRVELVLATVLVTALMGRATAQSGCTNALINLAPCLNFITGNSSTPSSSCCTQLTSVVVASPQCLCSVINGGGVPFGITINQTLALSLPGACNVNTPPLSRCQDANAPSGSANPPQSSPTDSPNETPEAALTPSASDVPLGGGSKSVPSTKGSSDGSSVRASMPLVLFLFFVLSCSSTFTPF